MPDVSPIDCSSYVGTDPYFGAPYVDVDEWREKPYPHRHVHGGFAGPVPDSNWIGADAAA